MPRLSIRLARPVIACGIAALLGLTSALPGPARAQQQYQQAGDPMLSQLLGALLIAGGLAHILDEDDDRRDDARRSAGRRDVPPVTVHRNFNPRIEPPRRHHPVVRALPASCLRDITGGRQVQRVLGRDCLQRQGVRAVLPAHCAARFRVGGRERVAYRASCLKDAGFSFR